MNVEEQTLPPVLVMRHHIGQQLRNLVHELFIECRRRRHPRDATPTPQSAYDFRQQRAVDSFESALTSTNVAYMQRYLDAPELARQSRVAAGLSCAALARRAGVPTSTVTRVESGASDPTVGMLTRLLAAAGHDLELVPLDEPTRWRLADAIELASDPNSSTGIEWTRLRSFTDWIRRHPSQLESAIRRPPARTGNELLDNVAAAIAERLSDDAGLPRPAWCSHVRRLDQRYVSSGTPLLQQRTIATTPPQFASRNVYLTKSSVWHEVS